MPPNLNPDFLERPGLLSAQLSRTVRAFRNVSRWPIWRISPAGIAQSMAFGRLIRLLTPADDGFVGFGELKLAQLLGGNPAKARFRE